MERKVLEGKIDAITEAVGQQFRTFGGGQATANNPMAAALKDEPLCFAGCVNVKDVVLAVLATAFETGMFELETGRVKE